MSLIRTALRSHWFAMILLCLIPLAVLVAIVGFRMPVTAAALIGLVLICPLGHFLLMRQAIDHDQHK